MRWSMNGKKEREREENWTPMSIYVRLAAYGPPSLEAIADRVPRRVDTPFQREGFIFLVLLRDRRTPLRKTQGKGKWWRGRSDRCRLRSTNCRFGQWFENVLVSIGTMSRIAPHHSKLCETTGIRISCMCSWLETIGRSCV